MKREIKDVLNADETTEILIMQCFDEAKRLDDLVELDVRKAIVGVGRKDEFLKFYFINKNSEIYVKFKNRPKPDALKDLNKQLLFKLINEVSVNFKEKPQKRIKSGVKCFMVSQSRHDFLSSLANGIDPLSGQKIFEPSQRLAQSLKSIALFLLRYEKIDSNGFRVISNNEEIEAMEKKVIEGKRAKQNLDGRMGTIWTSEEDAKLIKEYKSNMSIEEIAKLHGRTRSGIERRILKILPVEQIKK